MLKPLYLDTQTGAYKARSPTGDVFDFDVASVSGQTDFPVDAGLMTAESYVQVLVNGRESREGASYDFERDVPGDQIVFNYAVPQNAWVRVKIFPPFGVS